MTEKQSQIHEINFQQAVDFVNRDLTPDSNTPPWLKLLAQAIIVAKRQGRELQFDPELVERYIKMGI